MIYLIGKHTAMESGLSYLEGSRKDMIKQCIEAEVNQDIIISTDEINLFQRFLDFLGIDHLTVSGGPNANLYDGFGGYIDDPEGYIDFQLLYNKMHLDVLKDVDSNGKEANNVGAHTTTVAAD